MSRVEDVFEKLEPPPGGVTRLRARLAEEERRTRKQGWRLGALLASVAAMVALGTVGTVHLERQRTLSIFGPAVLEKAGLAQSEGAVQPRGAVVTELAARGEVIFYRVGQLSTTE